MNYFEEINSAAAEYFPASIFMIRYDSSATAVWRYNDDFSSVRQTLPHWHREQEIVYVENGELQFTVNGRHLPVCTGDILLINGFDIHAACGEGFVRVTQYVMPLFGNSQKTIALSFNLSDENKALHPGDPCYAQIRRELDSAWEVYRQRQPGCPLFVLGCLQKLTYYVNTLEPSYAEDSAAIRRSRFDYRKMTDLFTFIDQNYASNISISQAAEIMNLSTTYFCRFFKQAIGMTFFEYLKGYRCEKADMMLRSSDKSITQTALECGFSSPQYFSKVYKEYRGCMPSQTRKKEAPLYAGQSTVRGKELSEHEN